MTNANELTATADTFTATAGEASELDVLANDEDPDAGDSLSLNTRTGITVDSQPEGSNVTAEYDEENQDIDFTADTAGEYVFTYGVVDTNRGRDTAEVTVTVVGVDPEFTVDAAQSVVENTQSVVTLAGDDPQGDELSFSLVGGDDQALFELEGTNLQFIAAPDYETPADADGDNVYSVEAQVSDGENTATQTFQVEVTNANELTATADTFTATAGEASDLDVLANDEDPDAGDSLSLDTDAGISVDSQPEGSNVTAEYDVENQDIDFSADTAGEYLFTYGVEDTNGGTDTAQVTVTVSEGENGINLNVGSANDGETFDATTGDVLFDFADMSSDYGVSIQSFGDNDVLDFADVNGADSATVNVLSDSDQTDGEQVLEVSNGSNTVEVTLLGLTADQDSSIFNTSSFESTFAGTNLVL